MRDVVSSNSEEARAARLWRVRPPLRTEARQPERSGAEREKIFFALFLKKCSILVCAGKNL